jgi:hypothetical protein
MHTVNGFVCDRLKFIHDFFVKTFTSDRAFIND